MAREEVGGSGETPAWASLGLKKPEVHTLVLCVYYSLLQDSYIQSRADTMQNIESTIVELGSIFQQLAHMVKEQEETIQR